MEHSVEISFNGPQDKFLDYTNANLAFRFSEILNTDHDEKYTISLIKWTF